ncbi:MAG TPA: SemiSWEET transporter [Noviherbaspirillum sp.]|nr:SemiSWEET transporter [Noviherbaspirillum sp.]
MVFASLDQIDNLIGALAATLTTIAFIPQAWMTWKSKRAEGVSLGMYSIFTSGVAMWLLYGLVIGAWPVIIANVFTLALALFILVMKLRYG